MLWNARICKDISTKEMDIWAFTCYLKEGINSLRKCAKKVFKSLVGFCEICPKKNPSANFFLEIS